MIKFYIFASEQIRESFVWFITHFRQQMKIRICKKIMINLLWTHKIIISFFTRQSIGHGHRSNLLADVFICTVNASPFTCAVIILQNSSLQNHNFSRKRKAKLL